MFDDGKRERVPSGRKRDVVDSRRERVVGILDLERRKKLREQFEEGP